ncbi:shufflon system plasmid conjugative transfer pilus tip adhesin PilV [Enterobacterales bacterium CwR94]|nr:shufflon system plasmid conjugative transfer pilus tip adhesin PilV [Enterobacterales bacterium CwR94]
MSIVLAIVLIAAPIGMQRYASFIEEQSWTVTATHLSTASVAGRNYVRDNYDTLLAQVKATGSITITGQTLRDKGYLPSGFALANNSSQNYILAITRNQGQPEKLVAFMLTAGGQEMSFKAQRYIAQNTSGLGGYIYPANMANGAGGGWQINLSGLGLSGQSGHLVTYMTSDVLAGGAEESDRLYRFQVSGRPDLNRMHTDIDMNGSSLNKAKDVNAETGHYSGQLTAGSGAFSGAVTAGNDIRTTDGWFITKGNKGWMNETHGGGLYMDDNNWIKAANGKGISTTGQLKGGTVSAEGRLSTGDVIGLGKISVKGSDCTTIGDISRDAKGAILSCQDRKWKGAGTADAWFSKRILRGNTLDLGSHSYCALALASFDYNNWRACEITRKPNGNWQLRAQFIGNGQSECQAVCF